MNRIEETVRKWEAEGRPGLPPGIYSHITDGAGRVLPTDEQNDVYLTVEEMAKWLRVHPATIQRAAKIGQIPGRKIGRAWRFHKGEILEYIKGPGGR